MGDQELLFGPGIMIAWVCTSHWNHMSLFKTQVSTRIPWIQSLPSLLFISRFSTKMYYFFWTISHFPWLCPFLADSESTANLSEPCVWSKPYSWRPEGQHLKHSHSWGYCKNILICSCMCILIRGTDLVPRFCNSWLCGGLKLSVKQSYILPASSPQKEAGFLLITKFILGKPINLGTLPWSG